MNKPVLAGRLWRLFWVLALLQAADLATTHQLIAGGGREGNIFMRDIILTPIAPVLKAFALVFLASLIVGSSIRGRPAPHRLAAMMWVIFAVYLVVVLNNIAALLFPSPPR